MVTRSGTASISKVFTATAFLPFISQGNLSLEDRITKIIDLSGKKIPQDVKLKDLLTHTSGHVDDADEEVGKDYCALLVADAMISYYPQAGGYCLFHPCKPKLQCLGTAPADPDRYLSHLL
mgnify:CR=1 FL=1